MINAEAGTSNRHKFGQELLIGHIARMSIDGSRNRIRLIVDIDTCDKFSGGRNPGRVAVGIALAKSKIDGLIEVGK